jgi:hypothetical protein
VSADLIDFLEAGARFTPAGPGDVIEDSARHVLLATEDQCMVQGIRLEEDAVDNAVAHVRSFMRRHGARTANWLLCERSTPSDLEERLLSLGLTPAAHDYEIDGMWIARPPPLGPPDVEARPVQAPHEYVAARLLLYDVFGIPPDRRMDEASLAEEFAEVEQAETGITYGVWLDGRLAGAARSFFAPQGALLDIGATAEWARGRGAYRALVRARWDDVARRGGGALVVHARAMSSPILERLGFETVLHFRRLVDELEESKRHLTGT